MSVTDTLSVQPPVEVSAMARAAVGYESRWTYAALARVDADLGERFEEQRQLYWLARQAGDAVAAAEHGAAMVRAYDAITRRMEAEPVGAYFVGQCRRTGIKIAIGQNVAPAYQVDGVTYLTADEVATLLAEQPGFSEVSRAKALFPGAIVEKAADEIPYL